MMEKIIESSIDINFRIVNTKNVFVASITDPEFPLFNGCIAQANTEEEVKEKLSKTIKATMVFHMSEAKKYRKRCIFLGNRNKSQLWFTIVGIGLIFYKKPKDSKYTRKPSYRFRIGKRLYFDFLNMWKNKNLP